MTLALSILATVVAVVSLAITLRREWLDRAQLHVSMNPMTTPDGHGEIVALIENHGRQPALVKGVGFEWDVERGVLPGDLSGNILFNDPWARVRLEPGGHHEVRWEPDRLHSHADMPMRGFAEFGRQRRAWTKPIDAYRLLLVLGWQPVKDPPPEWLVPPAARPKARRIAAPWKLWKPKDERAATPAPEFDRSHQEIAQIRQRLVDDAASSEPRR